MKKSIVFPANLVHCLLQGPTVGYFDQPCIHHETDGFVMYKTNEKNYAKLYRVGFRRGKDGNAVSVTMENMMEHHGGEHKANFAVKPHEFVVVQDGKSDELSVFYYGGFIEDGMYYVGRFSDEMERKLLAYVNGMRKFFRDFARASREDAVRDYLAVEKRKDAVILTDKDEYHRLCRKSIVASNRMHATFCFENRLNRSKEQFKRDRANCRNRAVRIHQCADGVWRDVCGRVQMEDGYMEDSRF